MENGSGKAPVAVTPDGATSAPRREGGREGGSAAGAAVTVRGPLPGKSHRAELTGATWS